MTEQTELLPAPSPEEPPTIIWMEALEEFKCPHPGCPSTRFMVAETGTFHSEVILDQDGNPADHQSSHEDVESCRYYCRTCGESVSLPS